jgi:hypothetical protein
MVVPFTTPRLMTLTLGINDGIDTVDDARRPAGSTMHLESLTIQLRKNFSLFPALKF